MTLPEPVQGAAAPATSHSGPWGLGATLLMALAAWAASAVAQWFALLQLPTVAAWIGLQGPTWDEAQGALGFSWAVATLASAPTECACILLFVACRRGCSIRSYLAFRPVSRRTLAQWTLALLAVGLASDGINWLLGRPAVPDVMREAYRTAIFPPLLWFAVVICAPLTEELFFRGFLFRGLAASPIGPWGAIGVTSVVWAAAHFQYDPPELLVVAAVGVLLGFVRHRTDSLYPCLFLHALINVLATLQLILLG